MKKKKYFKVYLLSVLLGVFFLSLSVEINSFNKSYFTKSFIENKIEEESGKNLEELNAISEKLIDYLKLKGGNELLEDDFNEREVLHMIDVQVLFKYMSIIKYFSLLMSIIIFSLLYREHRNSFFKSLSNALNLNYIFPVLLAGLIYLDFEKYFTYFHLILFTNDLWLLDPSTDLLIQMLPEVFFIKIAIRILLLYFIFILVSQISLLALNKKLEKSEN